jgi:hypothetical protein
MIERDELFSTLEDIASSCHILPASNGFEDNHVHRYKFAQAPRESDSAQAQHA